MTPDGAVDEVEWKAPEGFALEAVAPDGRGGLWLIAVDRTLWLASPGRDAGAPRKVADVGSEAGAFAVAADGSLYLGDRSTLWHLPHPDTAPAEEAKETREPELVATQLGDVFGVVIAGDDTLLVSDWEGGRVLALDRASDGAGKTDSATPPASKATKAPAETRRPRLLASGLDHPSGLLALEDGSVIVKESGRQDHAPARLRRIGRDGKVTLWIELRRDDTR